MTQNVRDLALMRQLSKLAAKVINMIGNHLFFKLNSLPRKPVFLNRNIGGIIFLDQFILFNECVNKIK
jgi:hypothetical protein